MRKSKKIGTCIVHTQCIAHTNVTTQMSVGYLGIFQLLVVGLLPFSTLPDHPSPKYPASGWTILQEPVSSNCLLQQQCLVKQPVTSCSIGWTCCRIIPKMDNVIIIPDPPSKYQLHPKMSRMSQMCQLELWPCLILCIMKHWLRCNHSIMEHQHTKLRVILTHSWDSRMLWDLVSCSTLQALRRRLKTPKTWTFWSWIWFVNCVTIPLNLHLWKNWELVGRLPSAAGYISGDILSNLG